MLYLIGPPGAGKSSLMAELTKDQPRRVVRKPVAHTIFNMTTAELGYQRKHFSGTDALALNAQPAAERWLMQRPFRMMLAEGDRLSNAKFFRAATAAGYDLMVVCIQGSRIAAERRAARAAELGRPEQSASWVAGRETKVARLARDFEALILPAELPPPAQARILEDGGWHPFR